MDVKDSLGRTVSLLNPSLLRDLPASYHHELSADPPHLALYNPSLSPSTNSVPALDRSYSIDSAGPAMDSSYPSTPHSASGDFPFAAHSFYKQSDLSQQARPFDHQLAFPPTLSAPKVPQKKNHYPCPVSKQYACNEFFTTSGHAARHAKKHTGKKDAICPECGKAFTRKDNMEQHRRTHSGARAGANALTPPARFSTRDSTDEPRARRQRLQQRKVRPASISVPGPASPLSYHRPSQPQLSTEPDLALVDPILRSPMSMYNPGHDIPSTFPSLHHQPQPYPAATSHLSRSRLDQASFALPVSSNPHSAGSSSSAYGQQPFTFGDSSLSPSLVAPALDALALAASRQ